MTCMCHFVIAARVWQIVTTWLCTFCDCSQSMTDRYYMALYVLWLQSEHDRSLLHGFVQEVVWPWTYTLSKAGHVSQPALQEYEERYDREKSTGKVTFLRSHKAGHVSQPVLQEYEERCNREKSIGKVIRSLLGRQCFSTCSLKAKPLR